MVVVKRIVQTVAILRVKEYSISNYTGKKAINRDCPLNTCPPPKKA